MISEIGSNWNSMRQYFTMEPKVEEEENVEEDSDSKNSNHKSRKIKKSPKPNKRSLEPPTLNKQESAFSTLRLTPQFGVFESEMQKQSRLQKFWLVEIDNYYRNELSPPQKQMLHTIIEEEVPTLKEVLENYNKVLPQQKVAFDELFRYVQLVKECRSGRQLILIEQEDKRFLGIFSQSGQLDRIAQISEQEAFLLTQRQKFMQQLKQRQELYNKINSSNQHLSEISSEIAFLLYLIRQNKQRIDSTLIKINQRVQQQVKVDFKASERVKDKYVACLIRKNLKLALSNNSIDYYNYFANLDVIQQYGYGAEQEQKEITDKKEFEEYMKRKKTKKSRKNPKSVLKTACGGCLSPHFQQYNPFSYCPDCHVRFHKYCYTPIKDGLCESCYHKKQPIFKGRAVECQLCSNRGLLSVPLKSVKQGVSVHVFCMLVNGLWKFQDGQLQFQSNNFVNPNSHDDLCSICNSAVYTYACCKCQKKAHPLCAYLNGWNVDVPEQGGVTLQCCKGVQLQNNSYRRKFILNYKKILFKMQRDR